MMIRVGIVNNIIYDWAPKKVHISSVGLPEITAGRVNGSHPNGKKTLISQILVIDAIGWQSILPF